MTYSVANRENLFAFGWIGDLGACGEVERSRQQHRNHRYGQQGRVELCRACRTKSRAVRDFCASAARHGNILTDTEALL